MIRYILPIRIDILFNKNNDIVEMYMINVKFLRMYNIFQNNDILLIYFLLFYLLKVVLYDII